MTIPMNNPDSQSSEQLRASAEEAKRRRCGYFVQTRANGPLSYHRSLDRARDAAEKYGRNSPGACRATVYGIDEDSDIYRPRH